MVGRSVLLIGSGLILANCGSSPQRVADAGGVDPKYGVRPSPRVVAEGETVPRGGGRELVGKPYVVAGKTYTPRENPNYSAIGTASWYGSAFHGRLTANGEVFDRNSVSVAHPTLPLPSYVRVTNLANGYSIVARVNDRGPYHGGRLVDVSQRVAQALDFMTVGTARVKVDYVRKAGLAGSDDRLLMATLRTDGAPASLNGSIVPILVAQAQPAPASPRPAAPAAEPPAPARVQLAAAQEQVPAAPARIQTAALEMVGTPAPGVPLPPDRPFDLGAPASVSAPSAAPAPAIPMPPRRLAATGKIQSAALFYAEPDAPSAGFRRQDPMALLIAQSFVPLRSSSSGL